MSIVNGLEELFLALDNTVRNAWPVREVTLENHGVIYAQERNYII